MVELERLKGELKAPPQAPAAPDSSSMAPSKGSISLKELRLPLKADFVCSTANNPGRRSPEQGRTCPGPRVTDSTSVPPEATKHSFFIIIRAGAERMVATPLASTHRGLSGDTLTFPTEFTL